MAGPEQIPQEIAEKLLPIFIRYGIAKAVLFGSFARGEATRRSDVDLLLVQDTTKRFLDRYDGILGEITDAIQGRDVDVLIYTPEELERMADRPFIRTVLAEGIVIHESKREPLSGPALADDGQAGSSGSGTVVQC
jgi:predicted nucleotidyltransferase